MKQADGGEEVTKQRRRERCAETSASAEEVASNLDSAGCSQGSLTDACLATLRTQSRAPVTVKMTMLPEQPGPILTAWAGLGTGPPSTAETSGFVLFFRATRSKYRALSLQWLRTTGTPARAVCLRARDRAGLKPSAEPGKLGFGAGAAHTASTGFHSRASLTM